MSLYLGVEVVEPSALAFGAAASLAAALLVVVPLAVAIALLSRASRRLSPTAGSLRRASAGDLAGLQAELKINYNRLRRSGEAVPLATDLWRRLSRTSQAMPLAVRREVAQAYHAIEVSNRLLTASEAYDSRGLLSVRQRRLALWPTLETAIRGALSALGCRVTPAIQVRTRLAPRPEAAALPSAEPAVAAGKEKTAPSPLDEPPRLSLFYGTQATHATQATSGPAQLPPGRKGAAKGKARPGSRARKRPVRLQRMAIDGQMALWESVA